MAKVNIVNQKEEQNIGKGSIVNWNGEMHVVIWDSGHDAYKLLNLKTGVLNAKGYLLVDNLIRDNEIKLISNEVDIVIK